jgi:hypothetical protein
MHLHPLPHAQSSAYKTDLPDVDSIRDIGSHIFSKHEQKHHAKTSPSQLERSKNCSRPKPNRQDNKTSIKI